MYYCTIIRYCTYYDGTLLSCIIVQTSPMTMVHYYIIVFLQWFVANLSYQEALLDTQAGVVNVLSSTSGLFTLICAAIFPSSGADRFTLSKLCTVLIRYARVDMLCLNYGLIPKYKYAPIFPNFSKYSIST